ncbi:QcrA and Rieske domain-containing protein [Occallatibacter riparius]|uniref:Rieske 2Fe-2S domain-containing protein n=1 Tax=Occallatibacter riparius TaxID=1002689 RepID=A0A9J7BR71_9BACT|nr:Rieske 2Fe-2S domain-containing protein [Occallatibacter riparius]UWZ85372.1 Rieske 2Fe-2S domain-containing protein [Occallatibacter riparius]
MDEKLPPPSPQEQEERLHGERVSRRTFLMNVGVALNAIVGALVAVPVVGYLFGPVLRRKEYLQWIAIGNASDFPPGETRLVTFTNPVTDPWDGETAKIPAYVRSVEQGNFTVFAINCAHLGCPVRWFSESQLFMCPCHGGVYYADGSRASGPPERGLFTYEVKVENGKLMINAGQMPTLQNRAKSGPCPGAAEPKQPALIARIESCPDTSPAITARGTDASTIG